MNKKRSLFAKWAKLEVVLISNIKPGISISFCTDIKAYILERLKSFFAYPVNHVRNL